METTVRDLMTSPAVTCSSADSLATAARTMAAADIGSVVVTELGKVVGILTERDLLRAAAAVAEPEHEGVGLWMTAHPDVLSPEEQVDAAWASLTAHHYRHLPVVDGEELVGVVSLRDLMGLARIRPATETSIDVPAGLEGVVVAETTVGDVRGQEGFFHYRQYSAVDLAQHRSLEDVWHLMFRGELPDARAGRAPPRAGPPWRTARGSTQCRLGARGGNGLASDPRHRPGRALRPGARALRGGAHDFGRRQPDQGRTGAGGTPG
jgi:CBS domain-containing protein